MERVVSFCILYVRAGDERFFRYGGANVHATTLDEAFGKFHCLCLGQVVHASLFRELARFRGVVVRDLEGKSSRQ